MRIKSSKDFYSGLLFGVVGGAFAWGSTEYPIGSASQMGPGYFPLMLGILLAAVGLAVVLQSLALETGNGDPIGRIAWKPLCFIILANGVFGVLVGGLPAFGIPRLGLIVAIVVATFVAAGANDGFRSREVLILAIVLAALSYVVFSWLLKLRIPAWPAFVA